MATPVQAPDIQVTQNVGDGPLTYENPALQACLVAPAFEVRELNDQNGNLDPDSLYKDSDNNSYINFKPRTLSQTEFPGGRVTAITGGKTNVAAGMVDMEEDEIRAFVNYGGSVQELAEHAAATDTRVMKGFLARAEVSTRAFVRNKTAIDNAAGVAIKDMTLSICKDKRFGTAPHYVPSANDLQDTIITFTRGSLSNGNLTAQDVADQINAAIPNTAYLVAASSTTDYIYLVSDIFGAGSRIIVRGTGASETLNFHTAAQGDLYALGAGFVASDDGDGDQSSPFLVQYQGSDRNLETNILTGSAKRGEDLTKAASYDDAAHPVGLLNLTKHSGLSIKTGDEIRCAGGTLASPVAYLLQTATNTKLTLGTGPAAVANSAIVRAEVGLSTHATAPFCPDYVYFYARNLNKDAPLSSTKAALQGRNATSALWKDAQPARVDAGATSLGFSSAVTIKYQAIVDGVAQPERVLTIQGTASSLSDLALALNTGSASGLSVSPSLASYGEVYADGSGAAISFRTGDYNSGSPVDKTGPTQSIIVGDGTANATLDSASTPNWKTGEQYFGLGVYWDAASNKKGNNAGAYVKNDGIVAGAAGANSPSDKKFIVKASSDNELLVEYLLNANGDFSSLGSPYTDANLRAHYNIARELNGLAQDSAGRITIVSTTIGNVEDTSLAGRRFIDVPGLVKWHFQGSDEIVSISGTSVSGIGVGDNVVQASGFSGTVISVSGTDVTIQVTSTDPLVLTQDITKPSGGPTDKIGQPISSQAFKLGLNCSQEGYSNKVSVHQHSVDLLTQSIGFTDPQVVQGVGIRPGSKFFFELDENPYVLSATVGVESVQWKDLSGVQAVFLQDIVDDINNVVGHSVASIDGASAAKTLHLDSSKAGVPSVLRVKPQYAEGNAGYIELLGGANFTSDFIGLAYNEAQATTDGAASTMGVQGGGLLNKGLGRPRPDFAVTTSDPATVFINSQVLRDRMTGYPVGNASGDLYFSYRGLRTDLSAKHASDPNFALLELDPNDATDMRSKIGPFTTRNPLGLMARIASLQATDNFLPVLGLSDVVDGLDEDGTMDAWDEALRYLENKEEVYTIATPAQDRRIFEKIAAHVASMSTPEQGKERIVFFSTPKATRKADTLAGSGTRADGGGTSLQLDSSIIRALQVAGISTPASISASEGVFVEIPSSHLRWNVSSVTETSRTGSTITIRTAFSGSENADNFYSTTAMPASLVESDWKVYVRGGALATLEEEAEANGQSAAIYNSHRVRDIFAGSAVCTAGDLEETVHPGYIGAEYAAIIAQARLNEASNSRYSAGQPLTNLPLRGFKNIKGTNDTYSSGLLNIIGGGGRFVMVVDGTTVSCRDQLTTKPTGAFEHKEAHGAHSLDMTAKFLRQNKKQRTGGVILDSDAENNESTAIQARFEVLVRAGVLSSGTVSQFYVDESDPYQQNLVAECDVAVPRNIRIIKIYLNV